MGDGSGEVQGKAKVDVPAIGISVSVDVGQGRNIVFQTHIPQSTSPAGINSLLDQLDAAGERQQAKWQVEQLRANLEKQEETLKNLKGDLSRLDAEAQEAHENSPKRGPYKELPQTKTAKRQAAQNIQVYEREIGRFKKQIADCEAKIKG